jgi:hypothetical protein
MKKIILLTLTLIFSSCGVDKLNTKVNSSYESNLNTINTCGCISTYAPVCGTNGVNYDSVCIANCKQIPITKSGNCECKQELKVCGVDLKDYTECEANDVKIDILKYVPCSAKEF